MQAEPELPQAKAKSGASECELHRETNKHFMMANVEGNTQCGGKELGFLNFGTSNIVGKWNKLIFIITMCITIVVTAATAAAAVIQKLHFHVTLTSGNNNNNKNNISSNNTQPYPNNRGSRISAIQRAAVFMFGF